MNLLLFADDRTERHLPPEDARVAHIRNVLGMTAGDRFDTGVVNGPHGKALIVEDSQKEGMHLRIEWTREPEPSLPIDLIVGLPRPQTARKILRETTALGISSISFFESEKGEPSYRQSKLWTTAEWERQLIQGAEQAFTTRIPQVRHFQSLETAVSTGDGDRGRIALDVYEGTGPLSAMPDPQKSYTLAIGSERGWSAAERSILRENRFLILDLGGRVLRTETACVAAISIVAARMNWI